MDINQPKKNLNQTPFNQFSEKLISLNLKKKKKKANNLDISKSPSQKKYEIDEFEDLTIENGSKSYIEENDDNNNNHIDSIEKNQNDLLSLLNQLKTQNSILKKSTSNSINVNIMNNKFKFSFEGKKKTTKNKQSKNENFNVTSKDNISFRNNKESSPQKDNNTNNYLKESKSEKEEEIEKTESNINKEDLLKEIEEKKRLLELQEKEQREKIEKELREKLEKENKERIEKEIKEKIEKEYREKIEREEKERIEKEKKEKKEKEEKKKLEREQREKELEEKLKMEREQREKELEEKLQKEREEREKIQRELEEKLQKERKERERIERELKEKHEKEEKERIENEIKAKQIEELRMQKENEEKKRLEILEKERKEQLEKEKKEEEERTKKLNEEKKIKNGFVEPAMDKPLTNTQESVPFAIDDIEEIDEESEHTNEKIKILQSQISSGMLSPSGRFDNNNPKQSKKEEDQKEEDPSIKNVINTFLSPQKEEEEENISIKQISIEEEKENPKLKEIERVKALREKEKMELIKKIQPEEKIESNRSKKKEEKKEVQKIIPQIVDIGKILTTSKNYNENEMIKIDKSKYTEITKIELKEKPYLENSKDPPYGYLLQRRRKAFIDQSYFNDYILKEKNIIDQIKKISQNYQDILEESLKQFEQEKPFNSIFNAVMGHDNNFKEEMSEKLKLDSILKQSQEKSDEDKNMINFKQKMIGPIESLTNLAIYYSLSLNDLSIMKNLAQHFNYWRKIETDGDSFYRTFMFSLLEYYIFTKNNHEIQKIILAITRLSDDEIISNEQSVDFNQILVIFYFIYEQITKGNHYNAYKILLNAYELEDNSFDTAMTIYCRYAIYCNVDHLYNVYLRPKNSPYGGAENSARESKANLDGSTTIDKVSPSTIIKFGYEPLKIVFSAIPFIFNVNLEIIALDGGLSMKGNKIKVIYSKFTDYSLNDLPIISVGYFLSSYHKIYTKAYQNKILKSSCEDFFSPEEFNEKGAVLREVYIDPKEEQTICEKCNTQRKMIYFPRHFLSTCGKCFLKDLEQILKCRAIDYGKEKYNNIECKFTLYYYFRLFKRHTYKRKSLYKRL